MKLSKILLEIHAANEYLRKQIHIKKYHKIPPLPTGAVGPQGPWGSLDNYSDSQLLEMIRNGITDHRDLKQQLRRAENEPKNNVHAMQDEICKDPDLQGLMHLVTKDWELR